MDTHLKHLLANKKLPLLTIQAEEFVLAAVGVMNAYKVGALLVTENESLVGIFTERDVLTKVIGHCDPEYTKLHDVMTPSPLTVTPETTVGEAMEIINEKRFRHLPVLENNKLIGLISSGDIMHWLVANQEDEIKNLQHYIAGDSY
jgi:CBS domain-containing protein